MYMSVELALDER